MYNGKRVALLGLGRANTPLLDFFMKAGACLTVRDRQLKEKPNLPRNIIENPAIQWMLGEGYLDGLCEDILVRTPAIRPDIPPLLAAQAAGSQLLTGEELFASLSPAPLLGVTGSDGKTTTTTLAGLLLSAAYGEGRVYVGGNIGTPMMAHLPHITTGDFAVAEYSSFTLMSGDITPARAVITNITENHLNWHRGMAEYIAAKCRLLTETTHAVLNAECPITAKIAKERSEKTLFSSCRTHAALLAVFGVCHTITAENGAFCYDGEPLFPLSCLCIPGRHNQENAMAALGLVYPYLPDPRVAAHVFSAFRGVPHRLEWVGVARGVTYYNSSVDSTPTRTAAALAALGTSPILLCGGRGKNLSFAPLTRAARVAKMCILFGEAREDIASAMKKAGVPYRTAPCMAEALAMARDMAQPGDTVLLSPACTSFDEFRDFEERGALFKKLVQDYINEE